MFNVAGSKFGRDFSLGPDILGPIMRQGEPDPAFPVVAVFKAGTESTMKALVVQYVSTGSLEDFTGDTGDP
jgi:hypothetical protein